MVAKNRVIVLTPPGAAGIAVLRLVGPAVLPFLRKRFSREPALRRCVHGELRDDGGRVIDDPLVVLCEQEVADVNLHGGAWVVRAVTELARAEGFEAVDQAQGVWPDEAVDGGRWIDRQMLRWLPRAGTELAVRALLAQPAAWTRLVGRAARGELADGEIERIISDRSLAWLLDRPRVAIVGAANVGKSTLANRLFGQERSITADMAGTTRDWVGEVANVDGLAVMLLDTPGRRHTNDAIERAAIDASGAQIAAADLVVVVLDRSMVIGENERAILAAHPDAVIVANKADRPAAWDAAALGAIEVVATNGLGIEALRRRIMNRFGCADFDVNIARCWTDQQRATLRRAK